MSTLTTTNANRIAELIFKGIDAWTEAGKLLVEDLDNGATLAEVAQESGVSKDILSRFEQIGRNNLYPKLLTSTSSGARSLSLCTYSEQKHYFHNPVELLVLKDEGTDSIKVQLDNLTSSQVRQVFSNGHVRDLSEQRAYLEDKEEKKRTEKLEALEIGTGYIVKGKKVLFQKGCSMNKDDLISILARMK